MWKLSRDVAQFFQVCELRLAMWSVDEGVRARLREHRLLALSSLLLESLAMLSLRGLPLRSERAATWLRRLRLVLARPHAVIRLTVLFARLLHLLLVIYIVLLRYADDLASWEG